MKSRIMTLLTSCLLLWGGNLTASSAPDDDFNPENPAEPSAIDYCRLTVSADPAEGAYVSGSGRYTVGSGNYVWVSTSANNTEDYTYTFLYWTLNGERTSYSQDFYFTPVKGNCEFVAHYEKKEVVFDPDSPSEPSASTAKRKYFLYLTSNIEGACSFSMASGNKIKEGTPLDISVYPNQDYRFDGWKKDGVIISTDQYLYYTMPGETTTLEACFTEIPFDPDNPSEPTGSGTNVDNSTRMITEFSIGDADGYTDKTRVVINETKSLDYEVGCDASKFVSDVALYQIYSLDAEKTKYSINERPRDNGQVPLGIIVRKAGEVVIAATRLDCSVVLVDKVTNTECDLALNTYSFRCDAGTIEDRFYLKIAETSTIITANSYTIEYGDEIPVFEYTSEGVAVEGTPSITCEATKTSPVGTYPIIISKGTVTNNHDSYFNGTLTITKAPLKITAKDYTIKQGEALPTFEATYEGFKNNETSAVLKKQPTITTTATSGSEPGEYDITVSGAEAQNYEISYAKGKLTIQAPDLLPGDANGDGKIDAADIADIVNYMMGKPTSTGKFYERVADMNGDEVVNAADIIIIVNTILSE